MNRDFCTIVFDGYPGEWVGADRHERLREAARKLIGLYMADADLDEAINELEAAAGLHGLAGGE